MLIWKLPKNISNPKPHPSNLSFFLLQLPKSSKPRRPPLFTLLSYPSCLLFTKNTNNNNNKKNAINLGSLLLSWLPQLKYLPSLHNATSLFVPNLFLPNLLKKMGPHRPPTPSLRRLLLRLQAPTTGETIQEEIAFRQEKATSAPEAGAKGRRRRRGGRGRRRGSSIGSSVSAAQAPRWIHSGPPRPGPAGLVQADRHNCENLCNS